MKDIERSVGAVRGERKGEESPSLPPGLQPGTWAGSPASLALPDKPSIAVLPFQNMSGDSEQEYFADGMAEEIITGLARNRGLFVIARNSSFTFKGKSPDIRQVGRELGVRYVLEGSVRKAGGKVRITSRLIDASSGAHFWADRFDGVLDDIFDLQDQVTARVVGAISPALEVREINRVRRKVGNLQAYDHYLRGMHFVYEFTRESVSRALEHFREAVRIDDTLALAHAGLALCYVAQKSFLWFEDPVADAVRGESAARRALALDRTDARVLSLCGHAIRYLTGGQNFQESLTVLDQAVSIDPNQAMAWTWRGAAHNVAGRPLEAIQDLERALRLSPLDPLIFVALAQLAIANILLDRFDAAISFSADSNRLRPNHTMALRTLMVAHALGGELVEARRYCEMYRALHPSARIGAMGDLVPFQRDEDFQKFAEGLRLSGLPE